MPKSKKPKITDTHSLSKNWAKKYIDSRIPKIGEDGKKKRIEVEGKAVDQFRTLVDLIAGTILDEAIRVSVRSRSTLTVETLNQVTKAWLGEAGHE